jgi:DNA repair protein RadC
MNHPDSSGHRSRLRHRLRHDPQSLLDHELLELLLTYALPRRDTKPMAKELLARFGSLRATLWADPHQVHLVPGLGEASATLWLLLQELWARMEAEPVGAREQFTSPGQVAGFLRARLAHRPKEEFWVLLLDTKNRFLHLSRLSQGTVDQTAAYPREVAELALRHHASAIIIAHNHPSGDPTPSTADRELTLRLHRVCTDLGIRLLDHIIMGNPNFFSFQDAGAFT